MEERVYLDNNASTAVDPRVLEYLIQNLDAITGNPSSMHAFGRSARAKLTEARDKIANYLSVKPREIIFTSGGTEGINMVIKGIAPGGHIITSNVEHSAIENSLDGFDVSRLEVGEWGAVKAKQVEEAIRPDTKLIALISINNETGIKTDIEAIAKVASLSGIPFFVDGVAQLGKEPIVIPEGVSAMCFSGQKCHALKGSGFMFIRSGFKLKPLLTGGSQEYGRRAGSENLPGIIALGEAVKILSDSLPEFQSQMESLRNRLEKGLMEAIPGVSINGKGPRVCNTTNLSFEGIDGEELLTRLDLAGIAVSHGSACTSGALEPSRILLNMGYPRVRVQSSIRFSLSRFTTEEEIDRCIEVVRASFAKG